MPPTLPGGRGDALPWSQGLAGLTEGAPHLVLRAHEGWADGCLPWATRAHSSCRHQQSFGATITGDVKITSTVSGFPYFLPSSLRSGREKGAGSTLCLGSQARVLFLPHLDHLSCGRDGGTARHSHVPRSSQGHTPWGLREKSQPDPDASGSVAQPRAPFQETPGALALS